MRAEISREQREVDRDARDLHPREHGRQRPLDLAVDAVERRARGELGGERLGEGERRPTRARRASGRRCAIS